jgi:hypothetical protein
VYALPIGLYPGTGSNEGTHALWDKHYFNNHYNRSLQAVVSAIIGFNPDGSRVASYLDDAAASFLKAAAGDRTRKDTPARLLVKMKAYFTFLLHHVRNVISVVVDEEDSDVVYVKSEPLEGCLKRHDDATYTACSTRPPFVNAATEGMRRSLMHAGVKSFAKEVHGFKTMNLKTKACDCDFSHYHGSRSASGLCKHYWRWILFSKAALEGVSEVAEAVFRELKQYLTNREGSKQNKNEAFGKSNTIEELVEAIQKHGSVPPTGKVTVSQSFTAFQTPEFYVVKVKATTLAANWRFAAVNGDILVMQGMPRLRDEVVAIKYDGKETRVMIDESSATL